mgnify:CR=1 FL=1
MSRKKRKAQAAEAPDIEASGKDMYDWVQCLIVALIICVVFFAFFVRIIDVVGTSMNPTLNNSDKMLVSGLLYKPKVGDVVVFKKDEYNPNKALVKRVIAIEGQEINIDFDKGIVYIDGQPIQEDYIAELTKTKEDFIGPKTVPEGCVFVMGDNREWSKDSRLLQEPYIPAASIQGRMLLAFSIGSGQSWQGVRWIG